MTALDLRYLPVLLAAIGFAFFLPGAIGTVASLLMRWDVLPSASAPIAMPEQTSPRLITPEEIQRLLDLDQQRLQRIDELEHRIKSLEDRLHDAA